MKKQKLLILAVIFLAVMLAAGILYNSLSERMQGDRLATFSTEPENTGATELTEGTELPTHDQPQDFSAPDFTVVDLDGKEHKLSEFAGNPIVVNFWASWCGPCKSEMPDFQEAYEKYAGEIHFVMVNLTDGYQETVATAWKYIESQGYTFPVYFDTTYSASMAYGVNAVPVTYFIGTDGQVVAYGQGALDAETLQRGIDMILPK